MKNKIGKVIPLEKEDKTFITYGCETDEVRIITDYDKRGKYPKELLDAGWRITQSCLVHKYYTGIIEEVKKFYPKAFYSPMLLRKEE